MFDFNLFGVTDTPNATDDVHVLARLLVENDRELPVEVKSTAIPTYGARDRHGSQEIDGSKEIDMAQQMNLGLIALSRFGYGPRGDGDVEIATSDPRGFLKAELAEPGITLLSGPTLPTTKSAIQQFFQDQAIRKMDREATAAADARTKQYADLVALSPVFAKAQSDERTKIGDAAAKPMRPLSPPSRLSSATRPWRA